LCHRPKKIDGKNGGEKKEKKNLLLKPPVMSSHGNTQMMGTLNMVKGHMIFTNLHFFFDEASYYHYQRIHSSFQR